MTPATAQLVGPLAKTVVREKRLSCLERDGQADHTAVACLHGGTPLISGAARDALLGFWRSRALTASSTRCWSSGDAAAPR